MRTATSTEIIKIKIIDVFVVPDGVYRGIWSGWSVTVYDNKPRKKDELLAVLLAYKRVKGGGHPVRVEIKDRKGIIYAKQHLRNGGVDGSIKRKATADPKILTPRSRLVKRDRPDVLGRGKR
jgi:hypothetical protein